MARGETHLIYLVRLAWITKVPFLSRTVFKAVRH